MPIFEYRCEDCNKITEFLEGVGQGMVEKKCEHCGSWKLTRIFSKSYVSVSGNVIGSQNSRTCCGRTERCDTPPCSVNGTCVR
ncbi:MAG: FmdB family zinc ribbon protein [Candidatus Hydrogenedentota bacterium]